MAAGKTNAAFFNSNKRLVGKQPGYTGDIIVNFTKLMYQFKDKLLMLPDWKCLHNDTLSKITSRSS